MAWILHLNGIMKLLSAMFIFISFATYGQDGSKHFPKGSADQGYYIFGEEQYHSEVTTAPHFQEEQARFPLAENSGAYGIHTIENLEGNLRLAKTREDAMDQIRETENHEDWLLGLNARTFLKFAPHVQLALLSFTDSEHEDLLNRLQESHLKELSSEVREALLEKSSAPITLRQWGHLSTNTKDFSLDTHFDRLEPRILESIDPTTAEQLVMRKFGFNRERISLLHGSDEYQDYPRKLRLTRVVPLSLVALTGLAPFYVFPFETAAYLGFALTLFPGLLFFKISEVWEQKIAQRVKNQTGVDFSDSNFEYDNNKARALHALIYACSKGKPTDQP